MISHKELVSKMENSNADEIIKLSKEIGYPVYTRLCMPDEIRHKFVLLQDGAAAVIVNEKRQQKLISVSYRDAVVNLNKVFS